jgi:hypothetical protein
VEPYSAGVNTLILTRFKTYKIALPPKTKAKGGEGASDKINTCRKVPLQDTFLDNDISALLSISLIFLRIIYCITTVPAA